MSRIAVTALSMNATERLPGEAEMQPHATSDGRSDRTVDLSESMLGDLHDAISYMLPSASMSSSEGGGVQMASFAACDPEAITGSMLFEHQDRNLCEENGLVPHGGAARADGWGNHVVSRLIGDELHTVTLTEEEFQGRFGEEGIPVEACAFAGMDAAARKEAGEQSGKSSAQANSGARRNASANAMRKERHRSRKNGRGKDREDDKKGETENGQDPE